MDHGGNTPSDPHYQITLHRSSHTTTQLLTAQAELVFDEAGKARPGGRNRPETYFRRPRRSRYMPQGGNC
jgi:hypothetical protein